MVELGEPSRRVPAVALAVDDRACGDVDSKDVLDEFEREEYEIPRRHELVV